MMDQRMKFQSFKDAFGDWAKSFKPFIESEEMWKLYQKLKSDAAKDRIVPNSVDTFRVFSSCLMDAVKVVFFLQDPYPKLYRDGTPQATGIAMDCRNSPDGKIQPSLEFWYDAIDRYLQSKNHELLPGYSRIDKPPKCERSANLDYLHEQGVMLVNTELTCKLNKTGSHKGYWKEFHKYFLSEVMYSKTGIIYVLCGNQSHSLEEFINPLGNYIFKLEHPMAAGHRGDEVWRDNDIFHKINKILVDNNGPDSKIYWDKKEWDFYCNLPF